jgi:hypothetical protein
MSPLLSIIRIVIISKVITSKVIVGIAAMSKSGLALKGRGLSIFITCLCL